MSQPTSPVSLFSVIAPLLLGLAVACGGKAPAATPVEPTGDDPGGETTHASSSDGEMVPPEAMDQIKTALDRKRNAVARCLAPVIDNKELPKNARGKMTLEFIISPAGKAGSVKVVKADLESKALADCVINDVEQIEFPHLPKPLEWSYTYAFEAM
jgi:hypothetical protein